MVCVTSFAQANGMQRRAKAQKAEFTKMESNRQAVKNAAKETYNITISQYDSEFYSADNDWYCTLTSEDGTYKFYFDIVVSGTDIEMGHTYTLDDMLTEYSQGLDYNNYDYITYSSVSITFTTVGGYLHIEATVVDENGDTYNLVYDEATQVANMDTVDIVCSQVVMYDERSTQYQGIQFMGVNGDDTAYVFYSTTSEIEGNWTLSSMGTWVVYNGVEYSFSSGTATVTATANGYNIDAYIVCTNNTCYHCTMTYAEAGIDMANDVQVRLYPNPTASQLNVVADGVRRIDIIDAAGRIVMMRNQAGTIDLGRLAAGVYSVRTVTENGMNIQKVVKE